jgi:hypothetical protein
VSPIREANAATGPTRPELHFILARLSRHFDRSPLDFAQAPPARFRRKPRAELHQYGMSDVI